MSLKQSKQLSDFYASATKLATSKFHKTVEPEHLIAIIFSNEEYWGPYAEKIRFAKVKDACVEYLMSLETSKSTLQYMSLRTVNLFSIAENIASEAGASEVDVRHVLLACITEDFNRELNPGIIQEFVRIKAVFNSKKLTNKGKAVPEKNAENPLQEYAIDLTEKARQGLLGPVIGRNNEIRRIIQVLCRSTKNNPVLVGKPGVGKTALLEALAMRIASGDVPPMLKNKRLLTLDLSSVVAGASLRGQFEERIRGIIAEVKKSSGEILLFIDEVHTMVAGSNENSNTANLLKPALARGEIQILGSTTPEEFTKSIEKDKALERRFQMIPVEEPSFEESLSILRGLKPRFEAIHGLSINDAALSAAITLSSRYMPSRNLPDKAIDFIDEACSRLKIEMISMPVELDSLTRSLNHAKTELVTLQELQTEDAVNEVLKLQQTIKEASERLEDLTARWEQERNLVTKITELTDQTSEVAEMLESLEESGDTQRAAMLRASTKEGLEKDLQEHLSDLQELRLTSHLVNEEVGVQEVAQVVADITGIPVASMLESEKEKLLKMEDAIGSVVIGQKEAINSVSKAVRRSRSGLNDPNRPVGSFFFLGPTGTGKCLAPNTKVLCFDGSLVEAKDVKTGMQLMGPDSKPRNVLSTTTGRSPMRRIVPVNGEPWECNDAHILTLKRSDTGQVKDFQIDTYLDTSANYQKCWKQFSVGVDFEKRESLSWQPYWPIWRSRLQDVFCMPTNELLAEVRVSSKDDRMQFLAGCLDSKEISYLTNQGFEVIFDNPVYVETVAFVARSLGFKVVCLGDKVENGIVNKHIVISGDLHLIPTRVAEKQAPKSDRNHDPCLTSFDIEFLPEGDYAGFTLDGDGRFLLGDFTVTHNTELAKTLAKFLFSDEKNLIRLDMSEFMEKHTVARLIGSPPGYKGSDEGGQLTEAVRHKPYSVILFDEVEKAHPDIFNVLLQILDDGRLTDSQGRLVDFKNTVIIMTSNIGSRHLLDSTLEHGYVTEEAKEASLEALRQGFRPEFLGRIDEIVAFHGLTREHIEKIAEIQIKKIEGLMKDKKLGLHISPEAYTYLVDLGFQPAYGARPLRRVLQKELQDPLSTELLKGTFNPGDVVNVTVEDGALKFETTNNSL